MPIITDKELSATARPLWLKALSAVELRNYGYAIELIHAVLKEPRVFSMGVGSCAKRRSHIRRAKRA